MKLFALISFSILVLINGFDVYSTDYLIKRGAIEANPILQWFMQYFGIVGGMIVMKTIFLYILLEAWILYFDKLKQNKITKRETNYIVTGSLFVIAVYTFCMYTINFKLMMLDS